MKKAIVLSLALAMLLSGCGGNAKNSDLLKGLGGSSNDFSGAAELILLAALIPIAAVAAIFSLFSPADPEPWKSQEGKPAEVRPIGRGVNKGVQPVRLR